MASDWEKRIARGIQKGTNWNYTACLRALHDTILYQTEELGVARGEANKLILDALKQENWTFFGLKKQEQADG